MCVYICTTTVVSASYEYLVCVYYTYEVIGSTSTGEPFPRTLADWKHAPEASKCSTPDGVIDFGPLNS